MHSDISPRQAEYHNASFEMSDDMVRLRDPFTGDSLSKDSPPRSMEEYAGLSAGYQYLRSNPDIKVYIWGESHAGRVDHDEASRILTGVDGVFLEMFDNTEEAQDAFWNVSIKGSVKVSQELANAIGPYKMQQMEALAGAQKPVFLPEATRDSGEYEEVFIDYCHIVDKLLPLALDGNDDGALAAEIAVSVTTMLRDWYMIGKMGLQMQAYERATGQKLKNPLVWIGPAHAATMPDKFRSLGVDSVTNVDESLFGSLHEGNVSRVNGQINMVDAAKNGLTRIVRPMR